MASQSNQVRKPFLSYHLQFNIVDSVCFALCCTFCWTVYVRAHWIGSMVAGPQPSRAYSKPLAFRLLAHIQAAFITNVYGVIYSCHEAVCVWHSAECVFFGQEFVFGPPAHAAAAAWPRARARLITVISRRTRSRTEHTAFRRHFCRIPALWHTPPNTVRVWSVSAECLQFKQVEIESCRAANVVK